MLGYPGGKPAIKQERPSAPRAEGLQIKVVPSAHDRRRAKEALGRGHGLCERLKLVVRLRRFLVLEKARRPNLASRCLGLGLRELVGQWEKQHGYRPILAKASPRFETEPPTPSELHHA
jgi:hypothetical protein